MSRNIRMKVIFAAFLVLLVGLAAFTYEETELGPALCTQTMDAADLGINTANWEFQGKAFSIPYWQRQGEPSYFNTYTPSNGANPLDVTGQYRWYGAALYIACYEKIVYLPFYEIIVVYGRIQGWAGNVGFARQSNLGDCTTQWAELDDPDLPGGGGGAKVPPQTAPAALEPCSETPPSPGGGGGADSQNCTLWEVYVEEWNGSEWVYVEHLYYYWTCP